MRLEDLPAEDVRPLLVEERAELLSLLASLAPSDWRTATALPGWTVKDLALHLLDVDLGWLSRGRDGDASGVVTGNGTYVSFVKALDAKNQRWVEAARGLSPRLLRELLKWTGDLMADYHAGMDLAGKGGVYWASDGDVPMWFDIAQDLTERWVHQRQIRGALDRVETFDERYLPTVLRTFAWALPHQYRAVAAAGTQVAVDLGPGGPWVLTRRSSSWELDPGEADSPAASLRLSGDQAWRWLSGAPVDLPGEGEPELLEPLPRIRAVIA